MPYDIINLKCHNVFNLQHCIKKIRNSILKSGTSKDIQHKGRQILWRHFSSAYNWDREVNSLSVYHKLTAEHFELDTASKMRNKLAFEVLNADMLHLMKVSHMYIVEISIFKIFVNLISF